MRRTLRWGILGLALVGLCACATGQAVRHGDAAAKRGDWDSAVAYYREALGREPGRFDVKVALQHAMQAAAAEHLTRARQLEAENQLPGAAAEYRLVADLDPTNTLALTKANDLDRQIRQQIEASRPKPAIQSLREQAERNSPVPRLDPRTKLPLMKFPNVALRDILKSISDVTGINMTFDQGLEGQLSRPYSIDIQDLSLEEVLNQVLSANQLTFKVTNPKTIFIYQDNPANRAKYEDQYIQTFYLSHIDAQDAVQILNQLLATQGPAVRPLIMQNKTANAVVVKATDPVMRVVAGILDANDRPRAEIMVDVEILEVDRTRMRQLGLDLNNYALGFTFSPELAPPNTSGTFPPSNAPPFNLNTLSQGVSATDFYATVPAAQVRLMESDAHTKLLAHPQLRGREGANLTLNLGDEIPIPTTTFSAAAAGGINNIPTTQFQYRPVGVNLTITAPRVTYQDEIILDIQVEKSGVGQNVTIAGQTLPSFVSRRAATTMRLRDGESNLLAGLVKEEDRTTYTSLPGFSKIPILRSLFGNSNTSNDQSDVVIIVTPHIVRSHELTEADLKPMYVGTGQNFGAGSAPTLISPDAPPPPAVGGGGQAGGAATTPPPTGTTLPPATPPTGAPNRPAVVPIEPVTAAPAAPATQLPAQVVVTAPTDMQAGGGPYTVPITLNNVSQLGTITVSVAYDPKVLTATAVNPGTFMRQGSVNATFVPRIDAVAGRVDITVSRGTDVGAAGTGLLASITFQAAAAGATQISVGGVALDPAGKALPLQMVPAAVVVK